MTSRQSSSVWPESMRLHMKSFTALCKDANAWRLKLSRLLAITALYSLVTAIIWTMELLLICWLMGDWPFKYWGTWDGNHGPWGFDILGRHEGEVLVLTLIFMSLILSVCASLLSMLIKLTRFPVSVFAGSCISLYLAMGYLFWLID